MQIKGLRIIQPSIVNAREFFSQLFQNAKTIAARLINNLDASVEVLLAALQG